MKTRDENVAKKKQRSDASSTDVDPSRANAHKGKADIKEKYQQRLAAQRVKH